MEAHEAINTALELSPNNKEYQKIKKSISGVKEEDLSSEKGPDVMESMKGFMKRNNITNPKDINDSLFVKMVTVINTNKFCEKIFLFYFRWKNYQINMIQSEI